MSQPPGTPELNFLRRRPPARRDSPAPVTPATARAAPPAAPLAPTRADASPAPQLPELGFLRRRPPRRRALRELVRTGNPAVDLSGSGVRNHQVGTVPARSAATRTPAVPLRGRTVLNPVNPVVRIGGEQAATGSLQLTLTWSTLPTDQRSVSAGLRRSTDLHLGCLWEMNDGHAGAVQTLGDGAEAAPGYGSTVLRLGGRAEAEGQTLTVSLRQVSALKRFLVYAYAYSGQPEWQALAPVLTATLRGGVSLEVRLDSQPSPPDAGICAIASVHRVGGVLVLRREAELIAGQQQDVAVMYGWDLPWASGRTLPPLHVR